MSMMDVAKDINKAISRAAQAKHLDTRPELVNNVYPLLVAMLEAIDERFSETEAVLAEMLEDRETVLAPDFAASLQSTLTVADQICQFMLTLPMDDISKKRAEELVAAFQANLAQTNDLLLAAQVEDGEGDEEDGEGDEEDDSEEE